MALPARFYSACGLQAFCLVKPLARLLQLCRRGAQIVNLLIEVHGKSCFGWVSELFTVRPGSLKEPREPLPPDKAFGILDPAE
jgi:hypothetical protein